MTIKLATVASFASVKFSEACLFWLKLGFISFGGPAGQISIMHQELVERRRWISESQFLRALNYCMVLPGPEAQQLATYMGWLMHGVRGGIIAGGLFVLPSLFIIIALSWVYLSYGTVPVIASMFYFIKAAVVAIIFHAAYRIGSRVLKNALMGAIAVSGFIAVFWFEISFPYVVFSAAAVGFLLGHYFPAMFAMESHSPAKVDGQIPVEQQTDKTIAYKTIIGIFVIGILLWAIPLLLLMANYGWDGTLTRMAWFFTKAALLTFGGAYAVLPYVFQGAVEQYHWLTSLQMLDGLALGETTPGPLIMIVTFVGFLGAAQQSLFGPDAILLSGIAGGLVATFFTFLPSFIFILVGAPFVEASRFHFRLNATLTAITAINVGVIVNLGVFFTLHIISPASNFASIDWLAIGLIFLAVLLLFRFRITVIPLISIYAFVGAVAAIFTL